MPYTEFHYTPTGTGVISGKEVLEQTEDAINDLGGQISGDVQTAIDTANNALNTANTASADAQNAVNTANTAYTAATNAQNTANTAQSIATAAQSTATAAQNDVDALENVVTGIDGRLTTTEGNVTNLTTRMGTAEGNITTLQNDVITAQGTATSAQNTATLARGQAYVVRYASVVVSDNSTVPYTNLNNVDNIKANDLLLDTNGKLYQISAVDTANETVSVTTPLTQLAQDSDVVHKSGDETISGEKTFSSSPLIYNSNSSASIPQISLKNQKAVKSSTTETGTQSIYFTDKNNNALGQIEARVISNGSTALNITSFGFDSNNQNISSGIQILRSPTTANFTPNADNTVTCGRSLAKWSDVQTYKINALTPGSLSMPNFNNRIDISSYVTNLNGTYNAYTPSVDGWIAIQSSNATFIRIADTDSGGLGNTVTSQTAETLTCMIPVRANRQSNIYIVCTTLTSAYFIPCQGNV